MSNHLKRYFAPKSWKIKRKGIKFITKGSPGPHSSGRSMPINIILRDVLNYAENNREVKLILEKRNITIDGIKRKDHSFPVGLFDILSLNDLNEHFRVVLDNKGKIEVIKIAKGESELKLCKITGKNIIQGKIQLNLHDGKNIFVKENSYKVGDSILLNFGKKIVVKDHIRLDKNVLIYLTGGKHIGQIGKVQDIVENRILYKTELGEVVETLKSHAFPVGYDKPLITIKK